MHGCWGRTEIPPPCMSMSSRSGSPGCTATRGYTARSAPNASPPMTVPTSCYSSTTIPEWRSPNLLSEETLTEGDIRISTILILGEVDLRRRTFRDDPSQCLYRNHMCSTALDLFRPQHHLRLGAFVGDVNVSYQRIKRMRMQKPGNFGDE